MGLSTVAANGAGRAVAVIVRVASPMAGGASAESGLVWPLGFSRLSAAKQAKQAAAGAVVLYGAVGFATALVAIGLGVVSGEVTG